MTNAHKNVKNNYIPPLSNWNILICAAQVPRKNCRIRIGKQPRGSLITFPELSQLFRVPRRWTTALIKSAVPESKENDISRVKLVHVAVNGPEAKEWETKHADDTDKRDTGQFIVDNSTVPGLNN